MKISRLFVGLIAVVAIAMGCSDDDDLGSPSITLDTSSLSFSKAGGATLAQTVTINSTRDWTASCDADWVYVSPDHGYASSKGFTVSIYVEPNQSANRSATVTFTAASLSASITIFQTSADTDGGTRSNPYFVSDVLGLIISGAVPTEKVYVRGVVSQVDKIDTSTGYATYYISDDGSTIDCLTVYNGYSLGGDKFTASDEIKAGDSVIVYGELSSDGSDPSFLAGSKIYSLNGVSRDVFDGLDGLTGDGTIDNPYTATDALTVINAEAYTSSPVYVKGIISEIEELDTGSYGNATYYISNDGTTTDQFYIYRGYSLGGERFTSSDEIKVGDEVIVRGVLVMYNGETPEMTSGSSIYYLNGVTAEVKEDGPIEGDGTVNDPYSVGAALEIIYAGTYTNNSVYVKGVITQIDEIDTSSYGNATYFISYDGSGTYNSLEVYRGYSLGGNKFTSSNEIKVGDEVVVYGVLTMYGSTPEITQYSIIYSLNGSTTASGPEQGSDDRYVTTVTWTLGSKAYSETAIIDNEEYVILKLGTSSALGDATCTVPAGTTALTFYCIGWNNKGDAPFKVTAGEETFEGSGAQNSGLANNTPYTLTVSDSDYFTFELSSALTTDTTVKVETTGSASSNGRVGFIGFKYVQ